MKKIFRLKNLDCANCAAKMENGIRKIDGIRSASVSFLMQKMTLDLDESADMNRVIEEVISVCRKIEPDCEVIR